MVHPVKKYLEQDFPRDGGGVDYAKAAEKCRRLGLKIAPAYLEQFAEGYYCASYRVCAFIAARLCKGRVSIEEIARFPYSIRGCTWGAAVA